MYRLCGGDRKARRTIGFAALSVPFGIEETTLRMLNALCIAALGAIVDVKDGGRSRRHSGISILEGLGAVETIGVICCTCLSFVLPVFDDGVLETLWPKTLKGAAIALDIEGHSSVVATARPGSAEAWKAMMATKHLPFTSTATYPQPSRPEALYKEAVMNPRYAIRVRSVVNWMRP
jgi:hypothetical protein